MTSAATSAPILERSATALAVAIRAGEVSARAVVEEHIERLRAVQPAYRPLAMDRFDAALAEADAADDRAATVPAAELPPLHGVPCTIKESIALAGMPNAAGVVSRRDYRSETTAPAAQRLIDAGAIPLGVTNTSEFCLWIESDNFLYGRTSCAYDPTRIAGGSSGGEGAAVGSGASPIGLGTDIGGSIRLPAFFNGVFGHKPSQGLVPNTGSFPTTRGDASRYLATGPLVRRAEDLMPALSILAGPDGQDDYARGEVSLGDPAEVSLHGLPVLVSDDAYPYSRELLDARERAAGALAALGARVSRVRLKSARRAVELYLAALQDGAGTGIAELLEEAGADTSQPLRKAAAAAVRRQGPHTLQFVITMAAERVALRVPDRRRRRLLAAGRSLAQELEALPGDGVLLHPPFGTVAPRHGKTVGRAWSVVPAGLFNLAPVAVTQVPLGLNQDNLPLGVQVVAGCDNDHVSIRVALELERVFGGWVPPWRPAG